MIDKRSNGSENNAARLLRCYGDGNGASFETYDEGIILKGIGGFYYVLINRSIAECKARGIFRKTKITPLAGDRVSVRINSETEAGTFGVIEKIHSRKNCLERPPAANIDILFAVISVMLPSPDLMLLDKILVSAVEKSIKAAVCINKIDLDDGSNAEKIASAYRKAGYPVIFLDSVAEDYCHGKGYLELETLLEGKKAILAGQSGAGKSSIINNILKAEKMDIGELSIKTGRGKHTTRHVELIPLRKNGFIIDTPGFSLYEPDLDEASSLKEYFPEIAALEGRCRFTGCSHSGEPGCSAEQELLKGNIDSGRYERYKKMYEELTKKQKSYGRQETGKQQTDGKERT